MLLEPSNEWYWQYDLASQCIIIQLSGGLAMSCQLDKSNMNAVCKGRMYFTAEDSSYYFYFLESIKDLMLSDAQKTQLALNAVTNIRFHKIKMPQSWFFNFKNTGALFNTGDLISLSTADTIADFIVLESDELVSTCMLIQESLTLSERKELQQFEVIRVMNDRVSPSQKAVKLSPESILRSMKVIA